MKIILEKVDSKLGAPMGRPSKLPEDSNKAVKLYLQKIRWYDHDYDEGGAYWGGPIWGFNSARNWVSTPTVYVAANADQTIRVFVRVHNRAEAKSEIRKLLPNATFYR
jgi:hypothetical protein